MIPEMFKMAYRAIFPLRQVKPGSRYGSRLGSRSGFSTGSSLAVLFLGLALVVTSISLRAADDSVILSLEDADIRALVATVADVTGKNFILDPRVKGKVSVISKHPMSKDEVYQVFLSILEVHGFAAVPGKNVIKIVPDAQARQKNIPLEADNPPGSGDQLVTRVVKVDFANVQQLVPILRPLVPQQGYLAAIPAAKVLIITDRADNINRLVRIIRKVDRPSTDEIEVITLEHASASEVVRILTTLIQQESAGAKAAGQHKPTLIGDERTNSILLGGEKSSRLRLRAIISHLDTPIESGGNTQVVYLRYSEAKELATVLNSISTGITQSKAKKGAAPPAGKINIQADEFTNALVITAPPDMMRSLTAVIKQLDIRRAQVLVEAVIAEVSSDDNAELGIQWLSSTPNSGVFGGTSLPATSVGGINAFNPATLGLGLSVGYFRNGNLRSLIRALATNLSANILSTPSLVTLDNQEAEIIVGQNVPFLTGTQSTTGGVATPFQTITRQDVGLTLKVKPTINEGNTIKLDIEQETSSVVANPQITASDITTNKRSIKTTVLADDGSIVVLGGLIKDDLTQTTQKVPILGDIPLIGNLFKSTQNAKVKTNLMVFLHPVILRDAAVSAKLANSKYNFIRAEQMKVKEEGLLLLPDEEIPVMPPIDEYLTLPPPFNPDEETSDVSPTTTSPAPVEGS